MGITCNSCRFSVIPFDVVLIRYYSLFMETKRVSIYGALGNLLGILPCGGYLVRLDGETRADIWHRSQVEMV